MARRGWVSSNAVAVAVAAWAAAIREAEGLDFPAVGTRVAAAIRGAAVVILAAAIREVVAILAVAEDIRAAEARADIPMMTPAGAARLR